MSASAGSSGVATEQEFVVRVPSLENNHKKHHVMKFNDSLNIDFSKWSQVRMVRENNMKTFSSQAAGEMPKHGAGSEFGREQKEEARKKKFGYVSKKYNPDDQPWLMRVGGKAGRKYRGVREGGVADNTTYYVFTHAQDGSFEAYPVHEWYNFTPISRYKTLDADEAEERFAQRGKILNKWAVMVNKKLKPDNEDEEDLDGEGEAKKKGKKNDKEKKEFKISDMDDWEGSDDGLDTDDDDNKEDDSDNDKKAKKKGRSKDTKKKNKKKKNEDDEAFEDTDCEDDMEGREVDYMSDESSESEDDMEKEAEVKGVDQDEGLSKMLDSESSDSDEEKKKKEGENKSDDEKDKEKKDDESDEEGGKKKKKGSASNSRSTTPSKDVERADKAEKRKAMVANLLDPNASNEPAGKKSRLDQFGSSSGSAMGSAGNEAISEEAVRRYLNRRPMTTTDLLKKFRAKKTGIQNAQLVQLLANILKKINPHKQKIKGTTYLSIKEGK